MEVPMLVTDFLDRAVRLYPDKVAVVDGKPAISYCGDQYLRFANNSAVDGTGGWAITTVDDLDVQSTSLAVVDGRPAIAYIGWDMAATMLKFIISP